jgi:hypothetical protein
MNEKIKQLAEQATTRKFDGTGTDMGKLVLDQEKFAELIVRECIDVVKPTPDHEVWAQSYLGGVDGLELLEDKVKKIKQHFGVE